MFLFGVLVSSFLFSFIDHSPSFTSYFEVKTSSFNAAKPNKNVQRLFVFFFFGGGGGCS